jgi:hypothetical protein
MQSNPNLIQKRHTHNQYYPSLQSNHQTMKSTPEIINISSDSSSEDETPFETYVPPFRPPHDGCRTKEQARKRKHDLPVFKDLLNLNQTPSTSRGKQPMSPESPASSESSEDQAWIPVQPPPPVHHYQSPFIYTSSDEDEVEPSSNPPSTPERPPSSRPRPQPSPGLSLGPTKQNPPLPKDREVVLGLPCPRK